MTPRRHLPVAFFFLLAACPQRAGLVPRHSLARTGPRTSVRSLEVERVSGRRVEGPPSAAAPISMERDILRWTNVERLNQGVGALAWSPMLARAARSHSEEMARLGYFSHVSPTPSRRDVLKRVRLAGIHARSIFVGENIGKSTPRRHQARRFVESWMDSPGHRRNLLRSSYRYIGVGVARDGRWVIATQVFSTTDR